MIEMLVWLQWHSIGSFVAIAFHFFHIVSHCMMTYETHYLNLPTSIIKWAWQYHCISLNSISLILTFWLVPQSSQYNMDAFCGTETHTAEFLQYHIVSSHYVRVAIHKKGGKICTPILDMFGSDKYCEGHKYTSGLLVPSFQEIA